MGHRAAPSSDSMPRATPRALHRGPCCVAVPFLGDGIRGRCGDRRGHGKHSLRCRGARCCTPSSLSVHSWHDPSRTCPSRCPSSCPGRDGADLRTAGYRICAARTFHGESGRCEVPTKRGALLTLSPCQLSGRAAPLRFSRICCRFGWPSMASTRRLRGDLPSAKNGQRLAPLCTRGAYDVIRGEAAFSCVSPRETCL